MPLVVHGGENLACGVRVKNIGTAWGNFRLSGKTYYSDRNVSISFLFWGSKDFSLNPGEELIYPMTLSNFAGGSTTYFQDGQLFDVEWRLVCLDNGQEDVRWDRSVLQFSRAAVVTPVQPPPEPPPPTQPPAEPVTGPPRPSLPYVSLDKTVVYSADNVTATIQARNIGGSPGTFRLKGTIIYYGGPSSGLYAGAMTQRYKDYCSAPKESDWNYLDVSISTGQQVTLNMYKVNIDCGAGTFEDGQQFQVKWELTCLETSEMATYVNYFTNRRR